MKYLYYFKYVLLVIIGFMILLFLGSTVSIIIDGGLECTLEPAGFSGLIEIFKTPIQYGIAALALATLSITLFRIEQTSKQIRITEHYNRRANFIEYMLNGRFATYVEKITKNKSNPYIILFYNDLSTSIETNIISESYEKFLNEVNDVIKESENPMSGFELFVQKSDNLIGLHTIIELIVVQQKKCQIEELSKKKTLIGYLKFLALTDYYSYFNKNFKHILALERTMTRESNILFGLFATEEG